MTPADTLRAAVDRLRELADAAPEPPWTEDGVGDIGFGVAMGGGRGVDTGDDGPDGRAVAQYIAAMHPGVATALAKWLEVEAAQPLTAQHGPRCTADCTTTAALTVARRILGSTA
ncbi:hypothetical protein ACH4GG_27385 [Streptomyces albidoflavus]|uniref:hypothetical protein n=1 Tax=Streptomyces albidoflavus TaxID=1886 RepID=UPI0010F328DD|nr:hypothetical protein [Streptomyces albidoflavus]RZE18382.1 hypothetical protein C0Q96_28800 [Streptomyces albidoflavus]